MTCPYKTLALVALLAAAPLISQRLICGFNNLVQAQRIPHIVVGLQPNDKKTTLEEAPDLTHCIYILL